MKRRLPSARRAIHLGLVLVALAGCDGSAPRDDGGGGSGGAGGSGGGGGDETGADPDRASPDGTGAFCGGIANIQCPTGFFCEMAACGQGPDSGGNCVAVSDACPGIYDPVCGCNGMTYSNDCVRRAARVLKRADGACPVPAPPG